MEDHFNTALRVGIKFYLCPYYDCQPPNLVFVNRHAPRITAAFR